MSWIVPEMPRSPGGWARLAGLASIGALLGTVSGYALGRWRG